MKTINKTLAVVAAITLTGLVLFLAFLAASPAISANLSALLAGTSTPLPGEVIPLKPISGLTSLNATVEIDVNGLIDDFTPLAGDRYFAEDAAIVGGVGSFRGRSVVVIGHEKGNDTESRLKHNFGMARPEGYRKAVRLMDMADTFSMPVIALVRQ